VKMKLNPASIIDPTAPATLGVCQVHVDHRTRHANASANAHAGRTDACIGG
jgi:hypothetical protein